MPSESENIVVGFFHAMRAQAKRDRRRGLVEDGPVYRALQERAGEWIEAECKARRDAHDRAMGAID